MINGINCCPCDILGDEMGSTSEVLPHPECVGGLTRAPLAALFLQCRLSSKKELTDQLWLLRLRLLSFSQR